MTEQDPTPVVSSQAGEEKLLWFLRILHAAGGETNGDDSRFNWINYFCDDAEPLDTFNQASKRGLTRVMHDSDTDNSDVYLTEAGRSFIASPSPAPGGMGDLADELEIDTLAKLLWLIGFERAFDRKPNDPWENQDEQFKNKFRGTAQKIFTAGYVRTASQSAEVRERTIEECAKVADRGAAEMNALQEYALVREHKEPRTAANIAAHALLEAAAAIRSLAQTGVKL